MRRQAHSPLKYLRALGPGLVAGAADNDPTTVATMSVAGATTVFGLSWLTILVLPMLAAVQMIGAEVGLVARSGLQALVRKLYGRGWGMLLLVSVLAVNLVTIGADLEAGAAAFGLVFHIPFQWFVIPYALLLVAILFFGSYASVERVLKYVVLVFAAYIASAFLAHPDWGSVLRATVLPKISLNSAYVQAALAILGTTLTSYAYIWEEQEEAEKKSPLGSLGRARAGAGIGMVLAVAIFWFILVTTGATLGAHHKEVQTAEQAAAALKPVAGPLASYLFAMGLFASSFIAVPVLAATSGYLLCQEFGWRAGLSQKIQRARRFYAMVGATILVGVVISFAGVSPIQLLFVASIAGGLGTPIGLVFLLKVARDQRVMRRHRTGNLLMVVGWGTMLLVSAVSVYFMGQLLLSKLFGG